MITFTQLQNLGLPEGRSTFKGVVKNPNPFSPYCVFSREKVLITAPNLLRVGVNETVTVSVFNTNVAVPVTIYLEKRERGLAAPYSSSTLSVQQGE